NPLSKVATMNLDTRHLEFVQPSGQIKYWHDGEMVSIKGRRINALVTPNHGLWCKSGLIMKEWKYRPVFELRKRDHFHIPQACDWQAGVQMETFTIPNGYSPPHSKRISSLEKHHRGDDWLNFLGWFISEGSLCLFGQSKNKYRVTVSQSKRANP